MSGKEMKYRVPLTYVDSEGADRLKCVAYYVAKHSSDLHIVGWFLDRLCGLVVRVLNYRCRGPGFDSRALQKKVVGLERGPLSLVSTTEELLDRKVAAPA
jgi:hypothetical protein